MAFDYKFSCFTIRVKAGSWGFKILFWLLDFEGFLQDTQTYSSGYGISFTSLL